MQPRMVEQLALHNDRYNNISHWQSIKQTQISCFCATHSIDKWARLFKTFFKSSGGVWT